MAHSRGLATRLVVAGLASGLNGADDKADVLVVATDTRSMTEAEAVAETLRVCEEWKNGKASILPFSHFSIFKKTDSALRGHVVAELEALLSATRYRRALYLPANPSKGRTISGGVYYINGTPIAETDFLFDPEFPATTSSLGERFPDAAEKHIITPDATSTADVERLVAAYGDADTLLAGAADLFAAKLATLPTGTSAAAPPTWGTTGGCVLIVCGSTQSRPLQLGLPVAPMPLSVYDGATDLEGWQTDAYEPSHGLILTIPHRHRTGKAAAQHLRRMTALMVRRLVGVRRPDELFIEGGATAFATLQALGWASFQVEAELAPGVVRLRADNGTRVTLKPGSYPWGDLFQ